MIGVNLGHIIMYDNIVCMFILKSAIENIHRDTTNEFE